METIASGADVVNPSNARDPGRASRTYSDAS
jgi:hypothetical protein